MKIVSNGENKLETICMKCQTCFLGKIRQDGRDGPVTLICVS